MNPQNQPAPDPAQAPPPQIVHITRPLEPQEVIISPEVQKRHAESMVKYSSLNLSAGEYVISAIKRHPIGLFQIWFISASIVLILTIAIGYLISDPGGTVNSINPEAGNNLSLLSIPLLFAVALVLFGGAVGTFVFTANNFYLTNESVIQKIQTGLFNKRLQTVSLGNIEDASFTQNGILSHVFGYGSIRLSTEGEETTYRFDFASQPEKQIAILNNAVEAFKHGRPVEG